MSARIEKKSELQKHCSEHHVENLYSEIQQARQKGPDSGTGGGGTYSSAEKVRDALTSANQFVHSHGFPNVFITGSGGKNELIGQDDQGHRIHFKDGTKGRLTVTDDTGHQVAQDQRPANSTTNIKQPEDLGGGRIHSDGAGTYNIRASHQGAWSATRHIIEDQAHQRGMKDWHASNTDIANAERELAAAAGYRGKNAVNEWAKHLQPGDIHAPQSDLRGAGAYNGAKNSAGENPQIDKSSTEQTKEGGTRLKVEGKLNTDDVNNAGHQLGKLFGASDPRSSFKSFIESEKGTGAIKRATTAYSAPQNIGELYNADGTKHANVEGVQAEEFKSGSNGRRQFTLYGQPGHHTFGHVDKQGRMVVDKQD